MRPEPRTIETMIRIIVPGTIRDVTIRLTRGVARGGPPARRLVRRAAHVGGDVVERLRQRHAELLGLQLGGDEARQLLGGVAVAQRLERRAAAGAELHLAQRDQHLLPHGAAERLRHAASESR